MRTVSSIQTSVASPARNFTPTSADLDALGARVEHIGGNVLRYGLVAVLAFFGALKFTAAEAEGIRPFIVNSPLMAWVYNPLSVQGASNVIGVIELIIAGLIVARGWSPKAAAIGGLLGVGLFLTTLTFLVTTPSIWVSVPGFPLPVPNEVGAFLAKDLFLLGAALWTAGEALRSIHGRVR